MAKKLSISVSTLRKYRQLGMPHYCTGRKILVDPDQFYPWFEARFKVRPKTLKGQMDTIIDETLAELNIDVS